MRVLVTGATGRVGRRFVPRLLQWWGRGDGPYGDGGSGDGEHKAGGSGVRVLVRDRERGAPFAALGAEVAEGDLREPEGVRAALDGVQAVVNVAAAFRGVPDEEAWAVNRDAAIALARAAVAAGVSRFVQVGTNLVYGTGRGRPLTEDDPTVPGGALWGAYPAAKAEAEEELLRLGRETGLDVRIGSPAFVYGEGDPHLAEVLRWAGDWPGNRRLAMVHHADVAQGLLRLLRAPRALAGGRRYNLVDDAPATAVELHLLNGAPVPAGMGERLDDDPWYGIVSNARARDELGWRPLYPSMWTARDAGAL
ncbi:NAD(P)-dependent oxidoreductase [Streptomyces sp. JJ36]|uniref:NAD-dependent epimerase/dehydratase family protein n=1 Tax=Streptomyces sp. JJ36 TaxID=2736645 RepID=UPI001F18BEF2|nr:NAD(P)-dependent oxidoreductase [Streptomyces sp. JJ36]MCF6522120.1 NAD(P)-dependent oxidoreductase [Streptomyces sp. JJ36]